MPRALTLWMLCVCMPTLLALAAHAERSEPHSGSVSHLIRARSVQGDATRLAQPEPPGGRIVGIVTARDAGSKPLDFANVLLVGTKMGAMAQNGGRFSLAGVPPGNYSLQASFVEFVPQVIANVRVEPNATTVAKFCLEKDRRLVQVGTIEGTIVDRDTNKPLDFCNVRILGTSMGAMAKNGGRFTINLVPVGTCQVKAGFVGYHPLTIGDVRVDANKATLIDFRLKKGVASVVQTITVTSEAHKVDVKSATISHVTTGEEILSLPVDERAQGAALNTGVVVQGAELHLRGPCRRGEVSVRIDGVPVGHPPSAGSVDKRVQSPRATDAVMLNLIPQVRCGRVRPVTTNERPVPAARPDQPGSSSRHHGRVAAMLHSPALPPEVARRLDACECGTASAPTSFIAMVEEKGEPVSEEGGLPQVTRLWGCMPNPFNPMTTIHFELAAKGHVELQIYDVRGRRVRRLLSQEMKAGPQAVVWDGKTDAGRFVPSAVYFLRMEAGNFHARSKLIAVR